MAGVVRSWTWSITWMCWRRSRERWRVPHRWSNGGGPAAGPSAWIRSGRSSNTGQSPFSGRHRKSVNRLFESFWTFTNGQGKLSTYRWANSDDRSGPVRGIELTIWMRETTVAEDCGNDGAQESLENQRPVFHPSLGSLEISPTSRDSHIPTASTAPPLSPNPNTEQTEELATLDRWKPRIGSPTFPGSQTACGASRKPSEQPQERRLPAAARHPNLQDHLALELKIDFRIILRLEYARETLRLICRQ